jgi:hypothetical protein
VAGVVGVHHLHEAGGAAASAGGAVAAAAGEAVAVAVVLQRQSVRRRQKQQEREKAAVGYSEEVAGAPPLAASVVALAAAVRQKRRRAAARLQGRFAAVAASPVVVDFAFAEEVRDAVELVGALVKWVGKSDEQKYPEAVLEPPQHSKAQKKLMDGILGLEDHGNRLVAPHPYQMLRKIHLKISYLRCKNMQKLNNYI